MWYLIEVLLQLQIEMACQSLKRGYLRRNNKAREVNCRNQRKRRGERSQGANRSWANNNRKCWRAASLRDLNGEQFTWLVHKENEKKKQTPNVVILIDRREIRFVRCKATFASSQIVIIFGFVLSRSSWFLFA